MKKIQLFSLIALVTSFFSAKAHAGSMTLEQKYQDVFVSAGYATAMGAAVGTAVLVFQEEPTDHLRYIAIGASIGFFAGTAMGTYMVAAPSFADSDKSITNPPLNYAKAGAKEHQLILEPSLNTKDWRISSLNAGMVLAKF